MGIKNGVPPDNIFVVFFIKLIYKSFTAGIAQLVEWKLPKL